MLPYLITVGGDTRDLTTMHAIENGLSRLSVRHQRRSPFAWVIALENPYIVDLARELFHRGVVRSPRDVTITAVQPSEARRDIGQTMADSRNAAPTALSDTAAD